MLDEAMPRDGGRKMRTAPLLTDLSGEVAYRLIQLSRVVSRRRSASNGGGEQPCRWRRARDAADESAGAAWLGSD